ncbi:MAG: RDD family protein [Chlamydiota bacterium]
MKKLFWLDKTPSGWARVCARGVDYALFYLICSVASFFLPIYLDEIYYAAFVLVIPFLWAPIEAFLISRYKTTLGFFLLGIRIETHTAGRLPYLIALKRSCFLGVRPGVIRQKTLSIVRYTLAVLSLCVLMGVSFFEKEIAIVTTGFEKYKTIEGWMDYTACDGSFRVLLPQVPEEQSKILPVPSQNRTLNYQELTSHQTKKVYYSISYIQLPSKWKIAGATRLLQGALDLIIQHIPGAQLLQKNLTKHKNFRALDFHFSQGDEDVQGRLILVGMTLYRLTVVYPPDLAHQLQKTEFLDSFEIQG